MSREHFNVGDYVQINDGLIGRIIDYNYDSYFCDYRYKVSCSPVKLLKHHLILLGSLSINRQLT